MGLSASDPHPHGLVEGAAVPGKGRDLFEGVFGPQTGPARIEASAIEPGAVRAVSASVPRSFEGVQARETVQSLATSASRPVPYSPVKNALGPQSQNGMLEQELGLSTSSEPSPGLALSEPVQSSQDDAGPSFDGLFYAWLPAYLRSPDASRIESESGPLRVLHIGPCLARGGAELWLIDLVRFLGPNRVRIESTLALEPGLIDPSFVSDLPIPSARVSAEELRAIVTDYDVLLSWGLPLDDVLDGARPPLSVFVAHGEGWFSRHFLEKSMGHIDHVVAVSKRVAETACEGFPTTVIPNGVDTARLAVSQPRADVRRALGFGPRDFVVGFLGRFAPEKRPELLIDTVAEMPRNTKALLAGWGPLLPELQARANRLIPGRYAFVTPADYLGDFYQAMDAFCMLSACEGGPRVVLEAMLCEVPVIATSVGAVPELIGDRSNGLLVTPDRHAVRTALEAIRDQPHWARGLARQGRATARQQGLASRMARKYERLLWQLWTARTTSGTTPSTMF